MFLVDVAAAQVRVLRGSEQGYLLSPTVITGGVRAQDLAILPDGSTAYVLNAGTANNSITVVDVASLSSHVDEIAQSYVNLTGLQPAPDGRWLFAADTSAAAVRVLDPRSLRIVQTIPLTSKQGTVSGIGGLAVTPDGSGIFTANTVSQNLSVVGQIQLGTGPSPAGTRRPRTAGYRGLLMRYDLEGSSPAPATARPGSPDVMPGFWSPDVIPFGRNIAPDLTIFTSEAGYMTDYGTTVTLGNPNYIYVRGRNEGDTEITSRVYFYYTRSSLAMWPANWKSDNVTVNNEVRNWVEVTAPAGGVGVCAVPLIWTPPPPGLGSDHYSLIAWVSNPPHLEPPDFATYKSFARTADFAKYVLTHRNVGWRDAADIGAPPAGYAYNTALPMAEGGGSVYLHVAFKDVPIDGTFAVNVQGADAANSVTLAPSRVGDYFPGGYTPHNNPLFFPGGFTASVQVQYWPGATQRPSTAQITVSLLVEVGRELRREIDRAFRLRGLRIPVRKYGGTNVMVIGSTDYNLLFNGKTNRTEVP